MVFMAAFCGCGGGSSSSAPTAPAAPTGVAAAPLDKQATISWTAVAGATSYNVYWSTTTGVTPANGTKITGAINASTQAGLTNGATYYYVVTAVNSVGESVASSQVTCQLAAPTAPTGVTVTSGNTQTTVTWAAVPGAASYNLYWSTTASVTTASTKITGATNPSIQTGLTNGTTYYYVVTAVNALGESVASLQASGQPALPVPTAVTVTPGSGQVSVAWTAVPGATSYNLYRSTTTGVTPANGVKIAGVTSPSTQAGLTNGTTYYYVVTAVDATSESAASAQVSATPSALPVPAAPTGVIGTPGDGQVTIAWTAVTGATSYNVYRSTTTGVNPANGTKLTGAANPSTQTSLTNGTTYYYVVTAVNSNGESTASAQVSVTPSAPAILFTTAMLAGHTATIAATNTIHFVFAASSNTVVANGATSGTWAINSNGTLTVAFPTDSLTYTIVSGSGSTFSVTDTHASAPTTVEGPNTMTITPSFTSDMVSGKTFSYSEPAQQSTGTITYSTNGNLLSSGSTVGTWSINASGQLLWAIPSSGNTHTFTFVSSTGSVITATDVTTNPTSPGNNTGPYPSTFTLQ